MNKNFGSGSEKSPLKQKPQKATLFSRLLRRNAGKFSGKSEKNAKDAANSTSLKTLNMGFAGPATSVEMPGEKKGENTMSEKFQSTHIRLTVKQWERLRDEAHETRRSQSEIIREALEMRWAQKEKEEK